MKVLTFKLDNVTGSEVFKVRLAARKDLQRYFDDESFSPVHIMAERRLFLCKTIGRDHEMLQGDISSACFHGRLDEPVHFYLPQGHPKFADKT